MTEMTKARKVLTIDRKMNAVDTQYRLSECMQSVMARGYTVELNGEVLAKKITEEDKMNQMTYAFTPDNRMLAIWYRTGVINRATFIYMWGKHNAA